MSHNVAPPPGRKPGRHLHLLIATALMLGIASLVVLPLRGAFADGGDFSLDFIAAADNDYNHLTSPAQELAAGGLQYDSRAINDNVVEQLEAEDFACNDTIVFFTQITVDGGAVGTQSIDISYDFDAQNNGQVGVGYKDIVAVGMSGPTFPGGNQTAESGNSLSGNETVSLVSKIYNPGGGTPPTGFGT
ncbi:MAG TPA: hypothetical protein VFH62_07365, partial [Dehalococcoidia bacterium]|nr:hypothetical protein [Dehalococcoidia bacterium]